MTTTYILASCSRELRSVVLNKKYGCGRHINLVVSPLAETPQAIIRAGRLPHNGDCAVEGIPHQAIVHWYPEKLDIPGNNINGRASPHPLFGAVRFLLTLPRTVTTIYIGAKAITNSQRSYMEIAALYTTSCQLCVGHSGAVGGLDRETSRRRGRKGGERCVRGGRGGGNWNELDDKNACHEASGQREGDENIAPFRRAQAECCSFCGCRPRHLQP